MLNYVFKWLKVIKHISGHWSPVPRLQHTEWWQGVCIGRENDWRRMDAKSLSRSIWVFLTNDYVPRAVSVNKAALWPDYEKTCRCYVCTSTHFNIFCLNIVIIQGNRGCIWQLAFFVQYVHIHNTGLELYVYFMYFTVLRAFCRDYKCYTLKRKRSLFR